MGNTVEQNFVVNFIGKYDQVVLTGNFQHLQQDFIRVHGAGRVVRVDQHHGAGFIGDFAAHVVQIRHPASAFITDVMHRATAGQSHGTGPQRVIRCWQQYFVTVIEQTLHAGNDQLTDAVTENDVVDGDVGDVLLLGVLHDGFTRRKQALGILIAFRIRQVINNVLDDFIRRVQAKWFRVTDIQFQNTVTFIFHSLRRLQYRPTQIVKHIRQFVGFKNFLHGTLLPVLKGKVGMILFEA